MRELSFSEVEEVSGGFPFWVISYEQGVGGSNAGSGGLGFFYPVDGPVMPIPW